MKKVISRDGTQIACWSSGSGPPLVLVHGAMADHTRWSEVSAPLEEHFTVYTIDRRGRGESTDGPEYSLQRECDDLIAVVEHIGLPTAVLGHSYGADIALDAALMTDGISRLVLYEPGILEGVTGYYSSDRIAAALRETEDHIEAGRTQEGLVTFLRGVIDMSAADIEMMRSMPTWRNRLAAAHTLTREIRGEASWLFDPAKYRGMTVPTLLLTGSDTFQTARDGTYALHEALPNSRVAVMEGQGHAAMTSAPDLFAREVLDFLLETWPGRTEPR